MRELIDPVIIRIILNEDVYVIFMSFQETWHLDENTHLFNTINTDY